MTSSPPSRRFRLSEDWLATLIGLALVAVVGFGLLGPGAQSHRLEAEAGGDAVAYPLPIGGWTVSTTLGGEKVTVPDAPTALAAGSVTAFTCSDGQLALDPGLAATISARPPGGKATLLVVNECAADVVVTYSTGALVRWPLFNLFARQGAG